ncbi:uncharacterized protein L3040_006625 [Drepanopeziza brunnea f. sp. 'multigermtubi']|uniref:protein-tyrosine-phosphatase n=1 Tax=Marssonina brunnea f. sp. multigermtubi (strain MB_m1) TaxID=1072389 RepID=K1WIM7_MARBU|nr:protein-tyrosine phosphatase [Drepanopeziza brunnea f. sp. 'multigermtubi' MB_m1]EKD17510.1 protein-tyrosine phosphatase [Drepanopeziza brunnea f. sp. 'multigermtubi' MB_m1]KAJ5038952.1 hypothetical protein L3040_006625 [Drepanopeziza brunnea f. sp. 'multigermtubi']
MVLSNRPHPRPSQSHTTRPSSKPSSTTTPSSSVPRMAASVGQAYPPNAAPFRSPGVLLHNDVRTPSPNYFGLVVDPANNPSDSAVGPKDNWGTPTSSIHSFGRPTPQHLPLDANQEFAAFRKQAEGGSGFSLGHGNLSHFASTPSAHVRPKPDRKPTSPETQETTFSKSKPQARQGTADRMNTDAGQTLNAPSFFDIDIPRHQSPVPMSEAGPSLERHQLSNLDDRHPRLSLPQNKTDPPSPHLRQAQKFQQYRADTVPLSLEDGPAMISSAQLKDMMTALGTQVLLLDIRVNTQFSKSRIDGALNLNIPSIMLKRPSFDIQKLQDTFKDNAEKARFNQWNSAKSIVVYDAYASEKKDASSAINTLKKFSAEGWRGNSYIVRGGFSDFSKNFPQLIDSTPSHHETQPSNISLSLGTSGPDAMAVAGGCAMPASKNAANPFFSNIRQNEDLRAGVGLQDVKVPAELGQEFLPKWLLNTCAKEDHGKQVSEKFLRIELAEQSRMTKALNSGVSYGTPSLDSKHVQIAGIEKGSKNRYHNIWPFEHTRVKLQGRPQGACDYVNASHIKSSRSNKQYIASQGPLPATFEDFWSVIWDQDVRVIVMLTAEKERGLLKCHTYWAGREFGPLKLKLVTEVKRSIDPKMHRVSKVPQASGRPRAATNTEKAPPSPTTETPHVIVRTFMLAHTAHPFSPQREITQIHWSDWPDFGAPASPAQVLGLVELSNMYQRKHIAPTKSSRSDDPESDEASRPMLVHCSAGCGRTGTFCTIDTVIDMLKRQRKEARSGTTPMETGYSSSKGVSGDWIFDQDLDLVEKTVVDFRSQRLSMVQSLSQYVLCYETVLEWISQQKSGSRTDGDRNGSGRGVDREKP